MSGTVPILMSLPVDAWSDFLSPGVYSSVVHAGDHSWLLNGPTGMLTLLSVAGVLSLRRLWSSRPDSNNVGSAPAGSAAQEASSRHSRPDHDDRHAWNSLAHGQAAISVIDGLQERLSEALSGSDDNELRWLFNSVADGLGISDPFGRITRCNPAFLSILGVADATDLLITDLLGNISLEASEDVSRRLEQGATNLISEVRTGEGEDRLILRLNGSTLLDDDRKPRGFVWCLRDITQQRLADEMRNEFVFTATHELRTPLANLQAYAETLALEDGIDVERQKEFCNIIHSEAKRLTRFVDELLDVSQMEGGALSIQRTPLDMERLVEEVVGNVQPDITRRNQIFEYQPPAKMPKLTGDKDKLSSALVNLLGNASKYSPEGGTLGLQISLEDNQIHFHVDDTGFGISEDEQAHIFDKFFRSGDERVLAESGNGLGLAYTQQVAQLHGGRVTVKSQLNRGSRFTLTMSLT